MTRVLGPARLETEPVVPTAEISSPVIATASARGRPATPVKTRPLISTMLGTTASLSLIYFLTNGALLCELKGNWFAWTDSHRSSLESEARGVAFFCHVGKQERQFTRIL